MAPSLRVRKRQPRNPQACDRCRERKVKCIIVTSYDEPCRRCLKSGHECSFRFQLPHLSRNDVSSSSSAPETRLPTPVSRSESAGWESSWASLPDYAMSWPDGADAGGGWVSTDRGLVCTSPDPQTMRHNATLLVQNQGLYASVSSSSSPAILLSTPSVDYGSLWLDEGSGSYATASSSSSPGALFSTPPIDYGSSSSTSVIGHEEAYRSPHVPSMNPRFRNASHSSPSLLQPPTITRRLGRNELDYSVPIRSYSLNDALSHPTYSFWDNSYSSSSSFPGLEPLFADCQAEVVSGENSQSSSVSSLSLSSLETSYPPSHPAPPPAPPTPCLCPMCLRKDG
jgi:hypothetical protein